MKKYAICLFVYNRPAETARTVNALLECRQLDSFDIVCFCDGARTRSDEEAVTQVRAQINDFKGCFKEVILKEKNIGLKDSILSGITYVRQKYDGFVVLEDDIILHPDALSYVVFHLETQKNNVDLFHINLWNFPIIKARQPYLSHYLHCWGWASWSDRWLGVRTDSDTFRYISLWDRLKISKYLSTLHVSHLFANYVGKRNTWAIFWLAHIVVKGGLCISPASSLAENIGFQSGEHDEAFAFRQRIRKTGFKYRNRGLTKDRTSEFLSWVYSLTKIPKLAWLNSIRIMLFK